jgi:peptide-methionine (S)-S-oxide reductase
MRTAKPWLVSVPVLLVFCAAVYLGAKPAGPEKNPASPEEKVKAVKPEQPRTVLEPDSPAAGLARATFGGGCFWCTEAVFQRMNGVHSVVSGYSGGHVKNPSYQEVCNGTTGHAEAIQIIYDPKVITFEELLEVFWKTHDPTTKDQQGNDFGPQYRSVIFYHTDEQKRLAEHYKEKLDKSGIFPAPIVTEISPAKEFYRAESYHQNYFNLNPRQGYCQAIIGPKVEKLAKLFPNKLKQPDPK